MVCFKIKYVPASQYHSSLQSLQHSYSDITHHHNPMVIFWARPPMSRNYFSFAATFNSRFRSPPSRKISSNSSTSGIRIATWHIQKISLVLILNHLPHSTQYYPKNWAHAETFYPGFYELSDESRPRTTFVPRTTVVRLKVVHVIYFSAKWWDGLTFSLNRTILPILGSGRFEISQSTQVTYLYSTTLS